VWQRKGLFSFDSASVENKWVNGEAFWIEPVCGMRDLFGDLQVANWGGRNAPPGTTNPGEHVD
jgi:hypothetical protein